MKRLRQFLVSVKWMFCIAMLMAATACQPKVEQKPNEDYVVFSNAYIAANYPDAYNSYLRKEIDTLGLQPFETGDTASLNVLGATYLGGFGCYQMPTYSELFSMNVIGDATPEHMLVIAHGGSMFVNFSFFFFGKDGPKNPPFAQYGISAEDLSQIEFKPVSDPKRLDLLLYYDHFQSTYINAGVEIVHLDADTAYTIARIDTLFYDWKDYGKAYPDDNGLVLSENEAYRELSKLQFQDLNADGSLEIIQKIQKDIVIQNWDSLMISQLHLKQHVAQDSIHWIYSPTRRQYMKETQFDSRQ